MQRNAGAPFVGGALGGEGQPLHKGSSNHGGESDTGRVQTVLRCHGRLQAKTSGGNCGEQQAAASLEKQLVDDCSQNIRQQCLLKGVDGRL